MTRYIIRRLVYVVLVVFAVTLVAFTIFFVLPSTDPAVAFAGRSPTPELIAEVEQQREQQHHHRVMGHDHRPGAGALARIPEE